MLVSLNAGQAAERAAGAALAAGAEQAAALRHPERAAAWLRARTLRALTHLSGGAPAGAAERREALAALGVDDAVYQRLAAMSIRDRAALVASAIERFARIDIETILQASPAATGRIVARARDRYLRSVRERPSEMPSASPADAYGELARRVQAVASRAMSSEAERR